VSHGLVPSKYFGYSFSDRIVHALLLLACATTPAPAVPEGVSESSEGVA
jgi:hypothetical protein